MHYIKLSYFEQRTSPVFSLFSASFMFRPDRHFAEGITKLAHPALRSSTSEAGWSMTKLSTKLALQESFVKNTYLAKTSVQSARLGVAEGEAGCPSCPCMS
jgi:hypothetical protein